MSMDRKIQTNKEPGLKGSFPPFIELVIVQV